jgi:site-specific DNA recombinase
MQRTQVALDARVSSAPPAEPPTMARQVAAVCARVAAAGRAVSEALPCLDEGSRGAPLVRPALERRRDVRAAGSVDRLSGHAPERVARQDADPVLLVDACRRAGVEVVCLNRALGQSPEDARRLPVPGMLAEEERATLRERQRRGKRQAAQSGAVTGLRGAPSGYRSVPTDEGGGQARSALIPDAARVVRPGLAWSGHDRWTLGAVGRRLPQAGAVPRTGKTVWDRSVVWGIWQHPASHGVAALGQTRREPRRPRRRPPRPRPGQPRRAGSVRAVPPEAWSPLPVPALVEPAVCAAVQEQGQEHTRHARQPSRRGAWYRRQGWRQGPHGGEACDGKRRSPRARTGQPRASASDRGLGTEADRCGGERRCQHPPVRTALVDLAVWQAVGTWLVPPERLAEA